MHANLHYSIQIQQDPVQNRQDQSVRLKNYELGSSIITYEYLTLVEKKVDYPGQAWIYYFVVISVMLLFAVSVSIYHVFHGRVVTHYSIYFRIRNMDFVQQT